MTISPYRCLLSILILSLCLITDARCIKGIPTGYPRHSYDTCTRKESRESARRTDSTPSASLTTAGLAAEQIFVLEIDPTRRFRIYAVNRNPKLQRREQQNGKRFLHRLQLRQAIALE